MITGPTNPTDAFLCITAANIYVPGNDDCADAFDLSTSTNYELNNSNATVDANNTLCSGSTENNVWVKWTADFTGTAYVNLQNQDCIVANGMQMSIFEPSASCPDGSSTCIAYINPNNSNDFFGDFAVTTGETFYIQMDGYAGTGCEFDFCITSAANPDCATISPLGLVDNNFEAELNNSVVDLSWEIINEGYTPNYYIVERSENSIEFIEVARVNETKEELVYTTFDMSPLDGVSYYRLKRVSEVGSVSYSQIKAISVDADLFKELSLVPNPATSQLMLNFETELSQDAQLEIYDIAGRLIHSEVINANKGFNRINMDISGFDKGTYIVSIIKDDIRIQDTALFAGIILKFKQAIS